MPRLILPDAAPPQRQCAQLLVQACLVAATGLEQQNRAEESWDYLCRAHDVAIQTLPQSHRVPIVERIAAALSKVGLGDASIEARGTVLHLLERDGGAHVLAHRLARAELAMAKAQYGHSGAVDDLLGSLRWLEEMRPGRDGVADAAICRTKRCILDHMRPQRRVRVKASPSGFQLRTRSEGLV